MARSNGRGRSPLALVSRDADAAYYVREAAQRGGPVLVLGCAQGRIAWELCSQGLRVVGVDPSNVMIAAADSRRTQEPPEVSDRLKLVASDLRSLRLPDRFPVVIAPQNAAGLMTTRDDLDALFATVAHHLTAEGTFLFDAANPLAEELDGYDDEIAPPYLEPKRPLFTPHLRERRVSATEMGPIRRLRLGQFRPSEIDAALERAGLVATLRFGGFAGEPIAPSSPIQVVVSCRSRPA
jgi:SAM-dependent methyltransferase